MCMLYKNGYSLLHSFFLFVSTIPIILYCNAIWIFFFVDVYHSSYVFIITTIDKRISPNVAGWLLRPERLRLKH